jgi:hypothetical protein
MTSKDYDKLIRAFEDFEGVFQPFKNKGKGVMHVARMELYITKFHLFLINQKEKIERIERNSKKPNLGH